MRRDGDRYSSNQCVRDAYPMSDGIRTWLIRRWGLARTKSRFSFAGLRMVVPEGVLNPTMMRSSLFFARQCLHTAKEVSRRRGTRSEVLELGCGCGLASLVFAQHEARVVALDNNPNAAFATRNNARRNGYDVCAVVSDWDGALQEEQTFDVVILNPPFLAESLNNLADQWLESALFSGNDHEVLNAALLACARRLKAKGVARLLTSERSGEAKVSLLIEKSGLQTTQSVFRRIQGERFVVRTLRHSARSRERA